jgi:hypothetical protein
MLKLQKGYWGSNVETLGIQEYKGFHIVVDDCDMGMPEDKKDYRIGIYALPWDGEDAIEIHNGTYFNLERCQFEIETYIDSILKEKNNG